MASIHLHHVDEYNVKNSMEWFLFDLHLHNNNLKFSFARSRSVCCFKCLHNFTIESKVQFDRFRHIDQVQSKSRNYLISSSFVLMRSIQLKIVAEYVCTRYRMRIIYIFESQLKTHKHAGWAECVCVCVWCAARIWGSATTQV